jgi:diacylglycerol kinase (ATP)
MGVIPSGSGNDFAKLLGMDDDLETSVDQVLTGRTETIDSGTIHLVDKANRRTSRRFAKSISIRFDAVVAYDRQRIKSLKGIALYLLSVFKSLKNYRPHRFEMSFDGMKEEAEKYYLVCVGNGNREGGGFYVTPRAHPADGIFDICALRHVPIRGALKILRAYSKEHTENSLRSGF